MTALLEFKQKMKNLYGQYEIYILPAFKFVLALVYFMWINSTMGYMEQLDNIFIVLILSLVCCILPSSVTVFAGFLLILGHSYALGIDVAAFMLVLMLFLAIFFLRFSTRENIVLVYTPLSFGFNVPVLLPIGSGLIGSNLAAIPAACGVVIYYFIRFLHSRADVLMNSELMITERLTMMADALVKNWPMWITLVAFVAVVLVVNVIRTRSFDYAWRISILAGGVTYVLVMLMGGFFFNVIISIGPLILYTVLSVVIALVLEFFVFGGDYSRTERLQYEDDEYYYYVKAVPKAIVTTSERSIKKITAEPAKEEKQEEKPEKAVVVQKPDTDDIDFERKLEESLKDL